MGFGAGPGFLRLRAVVAYDKARTTRFFNAPIYAPGSRRMRLFLLSPALLSVLARLVEELLELFEFLHRVERGEGGQVNPPKRVGDDIGLGPD